MRRMVRSTAFWITSFCVALYWLLGLVTPPDVLVEIILGLLFGIALAIVATWTPAAWRSFRRGASEGEWQLIIAVSLTWFAIAARVGWSIAWRWMGQPPWMVDHPLFGFILWVGMLSGMLYITAPGTTGGDMPRHNWAWLIAAITVGALTSGLVIGSLLGE